MKRWRRLSLRGRITALVAIAVAVAVLAVSLTSWLLTRDSLLKQFDDQLQTYAQIAAKAATPEDALAMLRETDRRAPDDMPVHSEKLIVQFIDAQGKVEGAAGTPVPLPVGPMAEAVALGYAPGSSEVDKVDSDRFRVWIAPRQGGGAVQIARDSEGIERAMGQLGFLEILVSLAGVVGAALVGRAVARTALRPVDALTDAAEEVARTQELTGGITVESRGEIGRLAEAFNEMMDALGRSRDDQRRLAEDAGHELRTPLTSLRNNIELLIHADATGKALPEEDRARLLTDLEVQSAELTTLVGELIELSKGDKPPETSERVDLADVLAIAVERARPRAAYMRFETSLSSAEVTGRPAELERAVLNILDNAAKWSPPDGVVTVTLTTDDGHARIVVQDQGPGIAEDDLPHVFERFYRAGDARALPGSGLGLAIAQQVVTQHGGRVEAGNADEGGARFVLTLPLS